MLETDAAFGPFLIFGENVFGDQGQARGAANEFEVERVGLGDDEGEDGLAVGRGDGYEAFAGLEFGVEGEMEAELVDVEAETSVLVADIDINGVDAEMGRGLWGCCRGGHGEIIRRGAGREEKDNTDILGLPTSFRRLN